ncbi:hypothetical protein GOP47_0014709 [Adiantum capillus-veneris]|uniref:Cytochrome P450 n=1 Tax=Adiantum capillus-veneris TaxID=13818 RepID=A0A9D4UMR1_ADICA|nr:hypothetical protein GOP47_0014709 [Adiantum capillus-veneris]
MSWVVAAAVIANLVVIWVGRHRFAQRHSCDPKTWPLVGAQLETFRNFHRLHDWLLSFFSDHHRTVKLSLISTTLFFTVDPGNVEHILKGNFPNYPKGASARRAMYDFLGDGIFSSDGETWKKHRKVASLEFSNRKLRDFSTNAFREDALLLVQILDAVASSQKIVDLQDLLMRMTLNSICKVGFGIQIGSLSPALPDVPFGRSFDTVNEITATRLFNPLWELKKALNIGDEGVLKQEVEVLNSFTTNVIQKRRVELEGKDEGRADLLSRFMAYNEGQPGAFSDKELRDAILNFVIAGRDTSAITLSWFIYCMCNHPHVADRVFEETVEVLGLQEKTQNYSFEEVAERISYEALGKMHYLHAALTETLRLYPAVPRDGKLAAGDDILPDGTRVKRGDRVAYVPYSMGRMEFLWGADALTYNPDRWLQDGIFQPESPFKFSAFQAGPRVCLGKESAYLQMKMTAALLLYFFTFHIVPGHVVKYRVMLVMPMANGLRVRVSHR